MRIYSDSVKQVEVMERVHLIHDLLTEIRKQIKIIEKDFFSLVGEEFGDLTVLHRRDRTETTDEGELFIPSWHCHCTCGNEVVVPHSGLIDGSIKHCGLEVHIKEEN